MSTHWNEQPSLPKRIPLGVACAGSAAAAFPALANPSGVAETRGDGGDGWIDGTPNGERVDFDVKSERLHVQLHD